MVQTESTSGRFQYADVVFDQQSALVIHDRARRSGDGWHIAEAICWQSHAVTATRGTGAIHPFSRLSVVRVEVKPGPGHGLFTKWIVVKSAGIESEVTVLRRVGQGDECVSRVQIDRLGSDDDDRAPMLAEHVEGVKRSLSGPGIVVRRLLDRVMPRSPSRYMSRSTVQRATEWPSRLSCAWTFLAP